MILIRLTENDLGHVQIEYMHPTMKRSQGLPKGVTIKEYGLGRKEEEIAKYIVRDLKELRSSGYSQL